MIRDWIERHRLIPPGSRILAAVSGGPDSMAMITALHELSEDLGFTLAAAFFDHGIRPEAERERHLVESYCHARRLTLLSGSGNAPALSKGSGGSLEEAARELRYDFLESSAKSWDADFVALGHNRDDQVETILHHIIRGTGWRGLSGMPVKRGIFIRPVLCCAGPDLKAFLRNRRIRYAIDRSNRDNTLLRNRIRNRLLPFLRREFNPSIDDSLLRIRENILEGWRELAGSALETVPGREGDGAVNIPLEKLSTLSDFQIYLVLDAVLKERFNVMQDIEKTHFDAAKKLVRSGRSGTRISLPHGVILSREQLCLRITKREAGGGEKKRYSGEVLIPGEGEFRLPHWNLIADVSVEKPPGETCHGSFSEGLFAGIVFPFRVRTREAGDRMTPFGMKGRKKTSDILIDGKIPLHRRDDLPVFEDGGGIFWIPGICADDRTRITRSTRAAVRIKLRERDENG